MSNTTAEEMVKALVADVMLKALDEAKFEELRKGAIKYLLEPEPPSSLAFGAKPGPSRLVAMFNQQVSELAHKELKKYVADDEGIRDAIRAAAKRIIERLMTDELVLDTVAGKLVEGIRQLSWR